MDREKQLAIVRQAYAKQVTAAAWIGDPRIEEAYAAVRREDFLGPGPWPLFRGLGSYALTPSADPTFLYADRLVGIRPERHLNNGQPSLHAALMAAARIKRGEHVVQVGAGTGYYTAILAHLVGPSGRVTAFECDAELAARAKANLSTAPNVLVVGGDGAVTPLESADVIYVNAGVTRPAETWLDGLAEGGRLILPLTTDESFRAMEAIEPSTIEPSTFDLAATLTRMASRGAVFRIQRRGTEFDARWLCPAAFIPAQGLRDKASEAALAAAFDRGNWEKVTRLHRSDNIAAEHCWLRGDGWCLISDAGGQGDGQIEAR